MGGLRPCLFCLFREGVQNLGKPAYIILERSLSSNFRGSNFFSYKDLENEDFWLRPGHKYNIRVNQSCLFVTNSFIEYDLHSSDIKHD